MKKSDFKILVAEDDEIVRDVMVRFLQDEGYSVIAAHDGVSAIKLLRVEDIRLVLTDLRMPGADGMEVLRTAIQINPKAVVVILTAYGTLDTALEAMKEGAYDYVVKPFVMQQLLLVVRNAYKMTNLIEDNDELSRHLKEMYRNFEEFKNNHVEKGVSDEMEKLDVIGELEKLGIIDSEEAVMLRNRTTSRVGSDVIKKYSTLVDGLKKFNYDAD